MRNPRLVRLLMPVLLHRKESKCGPCVAWSSSGRPDIPEIHPEIPHGGISKKLSVLIYTLFGDSSESVSASGHCAGGPKEDCIQSWARISAPISPPPVRKSVFTGFGRIGMCPWECRWAPCSDLFPADVPLGNSFSIRIKRLSSSVIS